ncbi:DUF6783 domain-containing protein [uncultured Robinsoniella sp.]|uniref:DUF6783 domain-containing protein n=1 Tax=uncultured Robinsoniella sp. TaxID=904190 RepID=UPI00374FD96B
MHFAARACIKIPSCHLHIPLCGIFAPNSGYIARYAPFIRDKSPTNCDAQLTEMNFKTRSVPAYNPMGASRILSAKKHSGKVSKCTDLLYAFQTPLLVRPLLFPR